MTTKPLSGRLICLIVFSLLACATPRKKSKQRPKWGDNAARIQQLEFQRLEQKPALTNGNDGRSELAYRDELMNAQCKLVYQLERDKLSRFYYACSNPDWDEEEVKNRVRQSLERLYRAPLVKIFDGNQYDAYKSGDGWIYFRLERIHQTQETWRTFVAYVIHAPRPL